MSYEIIGNKVICQNDQTRMKLEVWIGDKDIGIYRCSKCNLTYDVRGFEFMNEPEERLEDD